MGAEPSIKTAVTACPHLSRRKIRPYFCTDQQKNRVQQAFSKSPAVRLQDHLILCADQLLHSYWDSGQIEEEQRVVAAEVEMTGLVDLPSGRPSFTTSVHEGDRRWFRFGQARRALSTAVQFQASVATQKQGMKGV